MAYMTVARADEQDYDSTNDFMHSAEHVLEKAKFSFSEPADNWEDWDEDDPDYLLCLKLRKRLADEEDVEENKLDNRILMYEFLKEKFAAASTGWRRVHAAAGAWEDYAQDPQKDYLHFAPQFERYHVAPEQ